MAARRRTDLHETINSGPVLRYPDRQIGIANRVTKFCAVNSAKHSPRIPDDAIPEIGIHPDFYAHRGRLEASRSSAFLIMPARILARDLQSGRGGRFEFVGHALAVKLQPVDDLVNHLRTRETALLDEVRLLSMMGEWLRLMILTCSERLEPIDIRLEAGMTTGMTRRDFARATAGATVRYRRDLHHGRGR